VNPEAAIPVAATNAWSIVDMALALGLGLSVLVGAWRGLVKEVLALLGWGVSYFAAQWWGPEAAATLPVGEPGSRLNVLAGMMVVFVGTWIAWALLTWAIKQIVQASGLSGADRLMGAAFGLFRGLLVAMVVFTLASLTPLTDWEPWRNARSLPYLQVLLDGMRPMLPPEVVKYLPSAHADAGD
jgi:membrane protein required for colicin V production